MHGEGIHIALKAEEVFSLFGLPITNTMLMSWLVMATLIAIAYFVGRSPAKIPSKVQTFFETLFGFLLDYIEEVLESRKLALRFFPLLTTLFLFILLGNWYGLIPGIGSITIDTHAGSYAEATGIPGDPLYAEAETHAEKEESHHAVSLIYPISTDLNVTLALAIIAFVAIEVSGVLYLGLLPYLGKFLNFRSVIGFLVGLIELLSELARLVSFSFRLFGNMFAGKTLILVAMYFLPYIVPVPLMLYEVFVGFIQAAIFTLLTLFFIKLAVSEAH